MPSYYMNRIVSCLCRILASNYGKPEKNHALSCPLRHIDQAAHLFTVYSIILLN